MTDPQPPYSPHTPGFGGSGVDTTRAALAARVAYADAQGLKGMSVNVEHVRALLASTEAQPRECWCSDVAQSYGLTDAGCPQHDPEAQPLTEPTDALLGFIDQTIYANSDNSPSVTWKNYEVLDLLKDVRALAAAARTQEGRDG